MAAALPFPSTARTRHLCRRLQYPAILKHDTNGTVLVTFPDVPEAVTFGADQDDALHHAVEGLETAFMAYIEDRRPIPDSQEKMGGDPSSFERSENRTL